MRHLSMFVLMIALVGSAVAMDPSAIQKPLKDSHQLMHSNVPDGRQGGDTMADATVVTTMPFDITGSTSGYVDDYDVVCFYSGSTSPDVVYSYTPTMDENLLVDLCGSDYDTKTYILLADGTDIACNDDFYPNGDPCGSYVSKIEEAALTAGVEYFIVIDGFGGEFGDYVLHMETFQPAPPCVITCNDTEGEPEMVSGYVDLYNGGCNSPNLSFQALEGDGNGELAFCGEGGWYENDTGEYRDLDWFTIIIGNTGVVEWTANTESPCNMAISVTLDCDNLQWANEVVDECEPLTRTIQGNEGDIVWVLFGSIGWQTPGDTFVYEFDFTGLLEGTVATENVTFDGIKSLYR